MKAKGEAISLFSALLMLSVLIPSSVSVEGSPDTWTFMVYLDADNNLESYAIKNFMQMSEVGSSANVKIIVQFDRIGGYDSSYGDWTNCSRFYVTQGSTPDSTPLTPAIGEVNMGDPATLVDFVTWANTNYPSDHMVLILWDHGADWSGVCYDDSSSDVLELTEISSALSTICANIGRPLDIVGFDACAMGSVEVGYQIREYADYYVASEGGTPFLGLAYDRPLWALTNESTMTPLEFANQIVSGYSDFYLGLKGMDAFNFFRQSLTLSTVDMDRIAPVVSALGNLSFELRNNIACWVNHIKIARNLTESYYRMANYDIVDIYDLADKLRNTIPNATVQSLATELINALDACIMNETHKNDPYGFSRPVNNAHGMSVYFPESNSTDVGVYGSISPFNFTQDSEWVTFLSTYYIEAAKGNPTVLYARPSGANASLSSSIELEFSEPMNESSLTESFSISPSLGGALQWNATGNVLAFTPYGCLAPLTQYTVRLLDNATDEDGNHTPANYSWIFTTRAFNTLLALHGEIGNDGWYVSPVNATLSTTDPGALNRTSYRVNNGSWATYSSNVMIQADGSNLLEYRSKTLSGYEDQVKNATIMVDLTAPSSTANVSGHRVAILSLDATSGINRTVYQVDGGAWQNYSSPFYINASGNHAVVYYSVDNAGNFEQNRTAWVDDSAGQPDFLSSYGLIIVIIIILSIAMAVIAYFLIKRRGKENLG